MRQHFAYVVEGITDKQAGVSRRVPRLLLRQTE